MDKQIIDVLFALEGGRLYANIQLNLDYFDKVDKPIVSRMIKEANINPWETHLLVTTEQDGSYEYSLFGIPITKEEYLPLLHRVREFMISTAKTYGWRGDGIDRAIYINNIHSHDIAHNIVFSGK